MKRVFTLLFISFILCACSAQVTDTVSQESQSNIFSESESSVLEQSESVAESSNLKNVYESEQEYEIGGSYEPCTEHIFSYHSIPQTLIDIVDKDAFSEWSDYYIAQDDQYSRFGEDYTIDAFIQHFNVSREDFVEATRGWMTDTRLNNLKMTREEYCEMYGYTDEQIDALYSGDPAEINRAFCGEMAYYNEADGQLYSVYWLSDHTAEDYAEAGLPETEIERILSLASSSGGSYAALAREAASAAAAYASLAEESADSDYDLNAIGGDMIQWDYNTNYTNIDGELIRYVGSDAFQSWVGEGYNPDVNLQTFIQQFGLTKDEFLQVTEQMPDYIRLSAEEIDALFSGDQAEINRTFASPYAAVSESGEIYTIFWLAEHDEADYAAAGLTAEAVGKAVDACVELGGLDSYVASAETALASMEDTVTE